MNELLVGLVGALLATNQPAAISNLVFKQTGAAVEIANPNDPVEIKFRQILEEDDASQEEVDRWIQENQKFAEQGAEIPGHILNEKIRTRFEPVRKAYDEFLKEHPKHARARIAYGSFLNDINDEEGAFEQLNIAKDIDPNDPAVWNNLANYHGHYGEPKKAMEYYGKAIALNTNEPIYYENLGTTVFLFRVDAREHYGITEQEVFDKALALYAHAMKLNPKSFVLSTFVAQTYYGIKPMRTNDALQAWTNAMNLAGNEVEREGTHVHLARTKMLAGWYEEARKHLNLVTNENYSALRVRLGKELDRRESESNQTNEPSATQ